MSKKWKEYTLRILGNNLSIYKDGKGQDEGYIVSVVSIPCDIVREVLEEGNNG